MTVLVDTGPLVALLDRSDTHHTVCSDLLNSRSDRLVVPITVVVEVCWLIEERPEAEATFLDSIATGEFALEPVRMVDVARTAELVRAYADFPLGAVDASVVAVAERLKITTVATLDRRHFGAVRPAHCGRSRAGTRAALTPSPGVVVGVRAAASSYRPAS